MKKAEINWKERALACLRKGTQQDWGPLNAICSLSMPIRDKNRNKNPAFEVTQFEKSTCSSCFLGNGLIITTQSVPYHMVCTLLKRRIRWLATNETKHATWTASKLVTSWRSGINNAADCGKQSLHHEMQFYSKSHKDGGKKKRTKKELEPPLWLHLFNLLVRFCQNECLVIPSAVRLVWCWLEGG